MKKVWFVFIAAAFLASCVSTKKYNEAVSGQKSLSEKLTSCENDKGKLAGEKTGMQTEITKLKKDQAFCKEESDKMKADLDKFKKINEENQAKIAKIKAELKAGFGGTEGVSVEERNGRIYVVMSNQVLYKSGQAELDEIGLTSVQTLAKIIKNNQGLNILVEGHTDNVPINNPKYKDNWDLSVARSVNVVRKLELYGVNPTRLTAAGRGEFSPVSETMNINDPKSRAKNRRTEFIISPPMSNLMKLMQEL